MNSCFQTSQGSLFVSQIFLGPILWVLRGGFRSLAREDHVASERSSYVRTHSTGHPKHPKLKLPCFLCLAAVGSMGVPPHQLILS